MKKTFKISYFIRLISAILIISFMAEQLSWAAPETAKLNLGSTQKVRFELPVPVSVARLEDVWLDVSLRAKRKCHCEEPKATKQSLLNIDCFAPSGLAMTPELTYGTYC